MFDFHMHSSVSFDSTEEAINMVKAAENLGLKEICFTDHYDFNSEKDGHHDLYTKEQYLAAYNDLTSPSVKIRRGVEFGLTPWNKNELNAYLKMLPQTDFVLGSVHYVGGTDPYFKEFWQGRDFRNAIDSYLEQVLICVQAHDNFDVLGHLTYVCKSAYNPLGKGIAYSEVCDVVDEILRTLVYKGKGIEVNTSGIDRIGEFLPTDEYLKRFRELGGEIVTVGSDAHDATRVGQYNKEAIKLIGEYFPYVCTFKDRTPVFNKIV